MPPIEQGPGKPLRLQPARVSISRLPVRLVDEGPVISGSFQRQAGATDAYGDQLVGYIAKSWAKNRPLSDAGNTVAGRYIAGAAALPVSAPGTRYWARRAAGGPGRAACAGRRLRATSFDAIIHNVPRAGVTDEVLMPG